MIGVKVNICTDFSFGALMHNVLMPPPIPVPAPSLSIEMVAQQDWPPGEFVNTHKRAIDVLHKGRRIVLEGHDCGPLIADITPLLPSNLYYAIMWPFSSRKITFSASTVQADGAPIGCAAPYLPMMSCGDPISAPTGIVLSAMNNTVEVGMTGTDLAIGLATAAVSMAIDGIFNKLGGNSISQQARHAVDRTASRAARAAARAAMTRAEAQALRRTIAHELAGKVFGFNDAASLAKRALNSAVDAVASHERARAAGAANADDWTVTHTVGLPGAGFSGSVTASPSDERRGVSRQTSWLNEQTAVSPTGAVQRTRNSVAVATPVVDAGRRP